MTIPLWLAFVFMFAHPLLTVAGIYFVARLVLRHERDRVRRLRAEREAERKGIYEMPHAGSSGFTSWETAMLKSVERAAREPVDPS